MAIMAAMIYGTTISIFVSKNMLRRWGEQEGIKQMDESQNPMHMVVIELKINQRNMVLRLSDFIVVPFFTLYP
jgi:hypothetical protein